MPAFRAQRPRKGEPFSIRLTLSTDRRDSRFSEIVAGIELQLQRRPAQEQWQDLTAAF